MCRLDMSFIQAISILWGCIFSSLAVCEEIKVDHITQVVGNLDRAILEYQSYGFTLKKGRAHPNGLENAFVQFRDGSEIELMSLTGVPKDEVAQRYKYKLDNYGEIITSIALAGDNLAAVKRSLAKESLETKIIKSEYWEYLVFTNNPELESLYLINIYQQPSDSEESNPIMQTPP